MVEEHELDGRGAAEVCHALGVDEIPDQVRVDLAHRHVSARNCGDGPGEAPAVAVEHRLEPEKDRLLGQPGDERFVERVQIGAAVRVLDAFRPAGRPGRVVDRNRVFLVLEPALGLLGGRTFEKLLIGIVGGAGVVDANDGDPRQIGRLHELCELGVEEQVTRAGVLQDVLDLVAREPRVDRDEDPACGGDAEVCLEHRGTVQ
jgi:hypothetical protein